MLRLRIIRVIRLLKIIIRLRVTRIITLRLSELLGLFDLGLYELIGLELMAC